MNRGRVQGSEDGVSLGFGGSASQHLTLKPSTYGARICYSVEIRGEIFLRVTLFHGVKKWFFDRFTMSIETHFFAFFGAAGAENQVLGVILKRNP